MSACHPFRSQVARYLTLALPCSLAYVAGGGSMVKLWLLVSVGVLMLYAVWRFGRGTGPSVARVRVDIPLG